MNPVPQRETATLGGGCYWCLEAVFEQLRGVGKVESGFAGGSVENPSYEQVCRGSTGHAEVVQITFDPSAISFRALLEVFFATHDPTTLNRQGADIGTQYRSAIFYHSPDQQRVARDLIEELDAAKIWDAPIVTEVVPISAYFKAEDTTKDTSDKTRIRDIVEQSSLRRWRNSEKHSHIFSTDDQMTAKDALMRLRSLGDPTVAEGAKRFFKTGADGVPSGDVFIGVSAAPLRKLARDLRDLPLDQVELLLHSDIHESRSLALAIMTEQFAKTDDRMRKQIYEFYLSNTNYVNSWDLVDLSARDLVGAFLNDRSRKPLHRLAKSKSLWERRIAIVATHHFIRLGDFTDTFAIAELLLADEEDLIHKAVGWMLREVGKRDRVALEGFLRKHHANMPRTTLRYAIERFSKPEKLSFLQGKFT